MAKKKYDKEKLMAKLAKRKNNAIIIPLNESDEEELEEGRFTSFFC